MEITTNVTKGKNSDYQYAGSVVFSIEQMLHQSERMRLREITIYCASGSYAPQYAAKNFLHYITETGFDSANLAVGALTAVAMIMIAGYIAIVSKRKKRTNG